MPLHTFRPDGTLLDETIYNPDHSQHDTNLIAAANASRVQGLIGVTNASAPSTSVDLRADYIVLKSATGAALPVVRTQATTLTCNTATAGPVPNGRDQAAVFSISGWVRFYFIWNGTTLATIASLALPITGPTLPTGYTHWAYATTILFTSGGTGLAQVVLRGDWVQYAFARTILSGGTAVVETALSTAAFVAPEAIFLQIYGVFRLSSPAGSAAEGTMNFRVIAGAGESAQIFTRAQNINSTAVASGSAILPNVNQSLFYILAWTTAISVTGNAFIQGYSVPNGG